MSNEKITQSSDVGDASRIDLGEDLLEKTAILVAEQLKVPSGKDPSLPSETSEMDRSHPSAFSPRAKPGGKFGLDQVEDYLASAKILVGEGFAEDAKRILHQILILDPGHAMARQTLTEIHEAEIKQIFSEGHERRPLFGQKKPHFLEEINSDALINQLDQDLELELFRPFQLFENSTLMDDFCVQLEKNLSLPDSSAKDWIDLGIGFLEMGLYSVATRLFEGAERRLLAGSDQATREYYSAICLQGLSQILAGNPFDAVVRLQPTIRDVEMKREDKIEVFYLIGRAYEAMKSLDLASYYYLQVVEIQPHYRDTLYRLKTV